MFKFENEIYLNFLYLLPLFLIIYLFYRKSNNSKLKKIGNVKSVLNLLPERSTIKQNIKFSLSLLAYSSFVIALANPQLGTKLETVKREGIEIIIALDISQSMLSEDIKPNRLERARQSIYSLIDKLTNDKIGLICFAGTSYLHLPITTDYSAAKLITSTLNTDLIQSQGTAIGSAIELAGKSFSESNKISKALVIITDGENHEDDAISASKKLNEEGIKVHCIGMGSLEGGPIPLYNGNNLIGFLKDESNQTVITKLDANALQQISNVGGGNFVRGNNFDTDILELVKNLSGMKKTEFETKIYKEYNSYFQYFIILGLFFTLLNYIIDYKQIKIFSKFNLSILIFIIFNINILFSQNEIYDGNKLYKNKKYKEAQNNYNKALKNIYEKDKLENDDYKNKDIAKFNLGNSLYKSDSLENSRNSYLDIANTSRDKKLKAKAYYNLGNAYLSEKKYKESIESYASSLKINNNDKEAKYNLEYALKMLKAQEGQKGDSEDKGDKKDKNNDENKKDGDNKDDNKKDKDNKSENGENENKQQNDPENNDLNKENKQENKEGKQAQQKPKISKEDADRILKAIQNNEMQLLKQKLKENKKTNTGKKW